MVTRRTPVMLIFVLAVAAGVLPGKLDVDIPGRRPAATSSPALTPEDALRRGAELVAKSTFRLTFEDADSTTTASIDGQAGNASMRSEQVNSAGDRATEKPPADVADQTAAIDVAVLAGASVIALGSYVDPRQPDVRRTIENAASHDVVIVLGAETAANMTLPHQVIKMGAMNADSRPSLGARLREVQPGGMSRPASRSNVDAGLGPSRPRQGGYDRP